MINRYSLRCEFEGSKGTETYVMPLIGGNLDAAMQRAQQHIRDGCRTVLIDNQTRTVIPVEDDHDHDH